LAGVLVQDMPFEDSSKMQNKFQKFWLLIEELQGLAWMTPGYSLIAIAFVGLTVPPKWKQPIFMSI